MICMVRSNHYLVQDAWFRKLHWSHMLRKLDLRGQTLSRGDLLGLIPRVSLGEENAGTVARELIHEVREYGEKALRQHASKFDGVSDYHIRVPQSEIDSAVESLTQELRTSLETSIARVRHASKAQVPPQNISQLAPGAHITQRWVPVERAGVYVPGGKAVYPSSVIMNVVPAQTAGVAQIILASPPQKEFGGQIHPTILAAAGLLGISDVYAMGGASAIGALAYGVPDIDLDPVNVITGPGNVYVAAAKREVRGYVGIDSEAGPTEILIIADDSARSHFVAADVISQAEHDELASSLVVTWDEEWADTFLRELTLSVDKTFHKDRVIASLSGSQSALVLVDGPQQAVSFSNAYAPEHLEIQTRNASEISLLTTNAGAIFVGDYTPVSLGDYAAGSNHVLPTNGQAHFSSGLGAHTFLRPQQVVEYDQPALRQLQETVRRLSDDEFLPAHGDAVDIRFSTEED